jgi:hypothetical protein
MVLWDSRTWHCNTKPSSAAVRAGFYICMLPKTGLTPEIRAARAAAARELRTSSHHPTRFKLFPKVPRWCDRAFCEKSLAIQQRTVLTDAQKKLADL